MYDFFIWSLTVIGILGIVVFSYKMAHSRGYPIGIVRKMPVSQESADKTSAAELRYLNEITDQLFEEQEIKREIVRLSAKDVSYYRNVIYPQLKIRRPLGQIGKQQAELEIRLSREELAQLTGTTLFTVNRLLSKWYERSEPQDPMLEEEVVEHGEALERHAKRFADIEKRIRRLEVKSVKELQEATEEKPQPPHVVH